MPFKSGIRNHFDCSYLCYKSRGRGLGEKKSHLIFKKRLTNTKETSIITIESEREVIKMNKENNNVQTTYQGVSFGGILTIVFITLKLLGKISWSWVWVLAPLWISFAFILLLLLILVIVVIIKK